MCGRYHLTAAPDLVAQVFGLAQVPSDYRPRYNLAPTQRVPVLRLHPHRGPRLDFLRWGLLPHWMDAPEQGPLLINARQETAGEKPAFRAALERRRCLLPATGFYEWQKVGRSRVPFSIQLRNHELFAFAGLWERWQAPGHAMIESVTILTTEANPKLAAIHSRMPVMLSPEQFESWLHPRLQGPTKLVPQMRGKGAEDVEIQRVSEHVNKAENDDPACLSPADLPGPLFRET